MANTDITIRGGYKPKRLTRDYHLDVFGNAVDKITQLHEKALQQKSAIAAAINQIELNEAEDEWKLNKINEIQQKIDDAAQFGNYANAYYTATNLANEVLTDKELSTKQRTNAQYNAWVKDIKARNIDNITKERLIAQNKYKYVPLKDNYGNVVGAKNWEDVGGLYGGHVEEPVDKVNLESLFIAANQFTAEHSGGGEGITAFDSDGNQVTIFDPTARGYKTSGSVYSYKDERALRETFEEMKRIHPEAIAYLSQQYRDYDWKAQELDDEIEQANKAGDIARATALRGEQEFYDKEIKPNGWPISIEEYLKNRSDKTIANMAYKNVKSSMSVSMPSSSRGSGSGTGDGEDGGPAHSNLGGVGGTGTVEEKQDIQSIDKTVDDVRRLIE